MIKLFITLGPSTLNKKFLTSITGNNIKLLRINLSISLDIVGLTLLLLNLQGDEVCYLYS